MIWDFVMRWSMLGALLLGGAMVLRVVWAQIQWNRQAERKRIIALFGDNGDVDTLREMGV